MAQRIKKGDTVVVITGADKGKSGQVKRILSKENRVIVEGINRVWKHVKPSQTYPQGGLAALASGSVEVVGVDALALALEAGDSRAVNTVMLGALSRRMGLAEELWQQALAACVPQKALEVNRKAFALGRKAGERDGLE